MNKTLGQDRHAAILASNPVALIIRAILHALVIAAASGIMVITVVNVVLRYAFYAPISGNDEIVQFLLAILIFAAFPLVTVNRRHFSVSIFSGRAHGVALFGSHLLELTVSLLGCAIMTYKLGSQARELIHDQMSTMVLGLPLGPLAAYMSFMSGLAFVGLVVVS